ncbi:hypothetical protein [Hyphomicrobium sp. CS1BSMeth3]|uniref:hypothetical protein n=1 Tax=Hyphomicrobium sp. CS1BSMeth3 TaxID=1892844 RepID=UPI000930470D|nr:hypothetical protein [Hyphomicrobium sp. CS1BSMeth3]
MMGKDVLSFTPPVDAPCRRASAFTLALFMRVRDWLTSSTPTAARRFCPREDPAKNGPGAHILQFPLLPRDRLMWLARDLQQRIRNDQDPMLLMLGPAPLQRLHIDSTAYVDITTGCLAYRVVLGDRLSSRITLETSDFGEAHSFVTQYLLLTRGSAEATT